MDKDKVKALQVSKDTSLKQAIQRLNETAEKILFATDEHNRLIGTITDGDIRRGIISGKQLAVTVQEVMNKKFISVKTDCPDLQEKAKELMKRHVIEQIPVVNDDGLLTDVVLWIDCLRAESKYPAKAALQNLVVIMAGGRGTRLDPFTKILPKPLIPLGDKAIVEHIMDQYYKNGFHRFVLVINYKKEMIKTYFNEGNRPYKIEYVEEDDYLGTAGGLSLLKNVLNNTFIVTNCDTILEGNYIDFYNWHTEKQNLMTIIGSHKEITVPYGILNMGDGHLIGIDEKPRFDVFINTGTYVFEPEVLNFVDKNEYINMDELIGRLKAHRQEELGVYPHLGGWFDIGQWEEYRKSLSELGYV